MANMLNVTTALGKDFEKLSGPGNYNKWVKLFEPVADIHGLSNLYKGTEDVIPKPEPPSFLHEKPDETTKPSKPSSKRTTRSGNSYGSEAPDTVPSTTPTSDAAVTLTQPPEHYQYLIAVYNAKVQDWKENDRQVRSALALLRGAVESWVWDELSTTEKSSPLVALNAIVKNNRTTSLMRLEQALKRLDDIKLSDPCAIRPFLVEFQDVYNDILEAKGSFSRAQLITKINNALTKHYNLPIQTWKMNNYGVDVTEDNFKKYRDLLLAYCEDNKERWQAAKDKPTEQRKAQSSRRNVNNSTQNNQVKCGHCGHNGHTDKTCRYINKPDTPRCTFCNKLGHTDKTCYQKGTDQKTSSKPSKPTSAHLAVNDTTDDDSIERIVASTNDFEDDFHTLMNLKCTYTRPPSSFHANASQDCSPAVDALVENMDGDRQRDTTYVDTVDNYNPSPAALAAMKTGTYSCNWICDSGASRHITNDSSIFSRLVQCKESIGACKVDSQLEICGTGDAEFVITNSKGKPTILQLTDVRYAPQARCNLLSLSTLAKSGPRFVALLDDDAIKVYRKDTKAEVAHAPLNHKSNVYILRTSPSPDLPVTAAAVDFDDPVWSEHRRLGHLSLDNMRKLLKISTGITVTDAQIKAKLKDICPICHTTRALYKIPRDPAKRHFDKFGQLITIDTWGPYPVFGLRKERYALFLVDDATRYTWAEPFDTKDKISAILIQTLKRLSNEHGLPIVRLRCDNEFVTHLVKQYCADNGVTLEPSVPYAHHMVGAAERSHRTVRERASAMITDAAPVSPITQAIVNRTEEMLRNATLPEGLWTYAILEAVNKKNRAPSKAFKYKKTPYEALYNKKPDLTKDNAWGARVYVTIPPELRNQGGHGKLHEPRAYIAHFLYRKNDTACYVWHSDERQVRLISIARIDNTTGMSDPQPSNLHINTRDPQPLVPVPDNTSEISHSSESEVDSDNADETPSTFNNSLALMAGDDEDDDHDMLPTRSGVMTTNLNQTINITRRHQERRENTGSILEPVHEAIPTADFRAMLHNFRAPTLPRSPPQHTDPSPFHPPLTNIAPSTKHKWKKTEHDTRVEEFIPGSSRAQTIKEERLLESNIIDLTMLPSGSESNDEDEGEQDDAVVDVPDTPPVSPIPHNIIDDANEVVPESRPASPATEDTFQCVTCTIRQATCQMEDGNTRCNACIKRRRKCANTTTDQRQTAKHCCAPCRETRNALTCHRANPNDPCNHCIEKGNRINCKPKQKRIRATPRDERCYPCSKLVNDHRAEHGAMPANRCNGEYPCNVCIQNNAVCISMANKDNIPCNHCTHSRIRCNRAKRCQNCVAENRPCTRWENNDTTYIQEHPEGALDNIPYRICHLCRLTGRTCTGDHPCYQCLTSDLKQVAKNSVCTMKTSSTTLVSKDKAAYTCTEMDDDGNYNVQYDENYQSTRKRTRFVSDKTDESSKSPAQPHDFDDDILDEDLMDMAMMAVDDTKSSLSQPEEFTIDEDLILDENLILDEDLQDAYAHLAMAATSISRTPRTYIEAMKLPDAEHWHTATQKELDSLRIKNVYETVALPFGAKIISSKFVYKTKLTPTGQIAKYKARLVARGFQQRPGIDYQEKYSPTARTTSIRTLLAICTLLGWKTTQADVYVAFLNAELQQELYIQPPPPVVLPKGHAWKLRKSLYGLVQAPRAWYELLTQKLIQLHFRVSPYDACVYIHTKTQLIISVHVDDIRLYGSQHSIINEFLDALSKVFTITTEDPDALYLGIHIEQQDNSIKIHQAEYCRRILERYNLENVPTAKTPCDHRVKLQRDKENKANAQFQTAYLKRFGSLNYLPSMTRVDLAYATSLYGRFNANPTQQHMDAITKAYAYVNSTKSMGITYSKQTPILAGYVDADWAGCPDTRRSTTGYVFTLAGGPISWSSTAQKVVAQSTCEAEYMALGDATKEAIWLKNFINDLGVGIVFNTVPIHVDNQAAIKLAKNPEFHARSKHIDIRHHFVRDHVRDGSITIQWISGKINPADMLTKPLDPVKFAAVCQSLGLLPTE